MLHVYAVFKQSVNACFLRERNWSAQVDMLTATDITYIMWQYVNSRDDCCSKFKLLKESKTVNMNKSEAEWTSDHKIAPMESRPDTDPGVRFYNSCLDWARGLKKLSKAVNGGPSDEYKAVQLL
jgi:hypothetical protein